MNNEERIKQLERQVQELLSWKLSKERQQISYPLDENSKQVLNKDFISLITRLEFTQSLVPEPFIALLVTQNGKQHMLPAYGSLFQFTAATTDVITSQVTFVDNMLVTLFTTDTLPAGLDDTTSYYTVNSSGNTCKLSLTLGGAAVDITDTGTGLHYFTVYNY